MTKPRGRPPGNLRTRERIAEAARELFLREGYRRTTLRAVAASADVDVALIGYHFGSKHGLFTAAMALLSAPSMALERALDGDRAGAPERLVEAVTGLWEDPELAGPLSGLSRLALTDESIMRLFREYLEREVLGRIAEFLGGPDATDRATVVVTVLGGLVYTRYLVNLYGSTGLTSRDAQRILVPVLCQVMAGPVRTGPDCSVREAAIEPPQATADPRPASR